MIFIDKYNFKIIYGDFKKWNISTLGGENNAPIIKEKYTK